MEKFKVKVTNKSEVLEIEKILSTIGMFSSDYSGFSYPKYIANNIDGEFSDYTMTDFGIDNFKLITIQELKDMVNQVQDEPFLTPETTLNDQYAEIEQVRQQTIEATLAERQAQYGCFEDVARTTGKIMEALSEVRVNGLNDLPYPHRMALYMIASKMARIVNGDFNHKDGWHDIGGYSKLIEDLL